MNAIQRALAYVRRRPAKSILLMITFFLIGNLVILGLGVSQAADNAKILTRQSMRAVVSYEVDYDAYYEYINSLTDSDEIEEAYKNYPRIDAEAATNLASQEHVKAFNYMKSSVMYLEGLEHVPVGNEDTYSAGSYYTEDGTEVEYKEPDIMVYANQYPNMIELEEGTFTIEDGQFYTQSNIDNADKVVLITEELADQNNLHVGDTFTLSQVSPMEKSTYTDAGISEDDLNLELEIIGIYSTVNDVDRSSESFDWMSPYESPKNIVLMPMTTYTEYYMDMASAQFRANPTWYEGMTESDYLESMLENATSPDKVVFLLDDPLNVDTFVEEQTPNLPQYTKLNANNETFKKMARPLDTLSFFSNILVWIVVVNAIVIITLVTALTLKTREYEIGVLLSIGVSKIKVVWQLFVELIIIAVLGFSLAVVSGSLLAGRVGDMVLNYQTESDAQYETSDDSYTYWSPSDDYFTDVTQEDLLSQYHVSVSPTLILEIYLLGTAVVLIAIVIPSVMIMRLNPKQILLEQN